MFTGIGRRLGILLTTYYCLLWYFQRTSILINCFAQFPCQKRYIHIPRFIMTLVSFCSNWLCLYELVGRRLGNHILWLVTCYDTTLKGITKICSMFHVFFCCCKNNDPKILWIAPYVGMSKWRIQSDIYWMTTWNA